MPTVPYCKKGVVCQKGCSVSKNQKRLSFAYCLVGDVLKNGINKIKTDEKNLKTNN